MVAKKKRTCKTCGKKIISGSNNQKYHPGRCLYIANNLRRPAAKRMGRDAAIEYYGEQFDDELLQLVGKTKYMPHLRHIAAWCEKAETNTFTEKEISEGFDGVLRYYELAAIHRKFGIVFACGKQGILGHEPLTETLWCFSLDYYSGDK